MGATTTTTTTFRLVSRTELQQELVDRAEDSASTSRIRGKTDWNKDNCVIATVVASVAVIRILLKRP